MKFSSPSCLSTLFILAHSGLTQAANLRQARNEAANEELTVLHNKKSATVPHLQGRHLSTTFTRQDSSPSNDIQWKTKGLHGKHDDRSLSSMPYEDYDECADDEILVTIELTTDWYGNETSLEIVRESDGVIVLSGYGLMNGESYWTSSCLPKDCYKFTIHDSRGDGMCCDYGLGKYTVYTGAEYNVIASGGVFGSSESVTFGGECQPSPEYTKTKCVNVTVAFTTDNTPWETYLGLYDLSGYATNYWGYDQYFDQPNHEYTVTQCIDPTKCYELNVNDYGEDGLAGKTFTVTYSGETVDLSGDDVYFRSAIIGSSACASRPSCVDLTLSLTTDESATNETYVGLYDLMTGSSFWYDTIIDESNQEYEFSKCIDPFRCYDVFVYSWNEDGSLSDITTSLVYGGASVPTNFTYYSDYYVGEGCAALGITNDHYY